MNRISSDAWGFAKAKFEPGFQAKGVSIAPQQTGPVRSACGAQLNRQIVRRLLRPGQL